MLCYNEKIDAVLQKWENLCSFALMGKLMQFYYNETIGAVFLQCKNGAVLIQWENWCRFAIMGKLM